MCFKKELGNKVTKALLQSKKDELKEKMFFQRKEESVLKSQKAAKSQEKDEKWRLKISFLSSIYAKYV